MISGRDIICFGSADWDNPFRTNQHYIVERLAAGNRVLFVESLGLRRPVFQRKDLFRIIKRLLRGLKPFKKVRRGLYIFSPLVFPFHKYRAVRALNGLILRLNLKMFVWLAGFRNPVLWSYIPNAVDLKDFLAAEVMVYHCVDELSANPLIPDQIRVLEKRMLKESDLVFVTSKNLFRTKKRFNRNTYYMPNVADFQHFNRAVEDLDIPDDISGFRKPVIGFIGSLSEYKLDFELIEYCADRLGEASFILIGPVGEGEREADLRDLLKTGNIHYLGSREFSLLPEYLKAFDVCLLPNRINEYTKNMFPLKFFEYLAAGKPVVSTGLDSLKDFSGYFYLSNGREEFAENIVKALKEDVGLREKRIELASRYTWNARVREMSALIEKVRPGG